MSNAIRQIQLNKLIAHPDNPNRMAKNNFIRLTRNIKKTGNYEPVVARPHPSRDGMFEIINGHHRRKALEQLGYDKIDAVVWDLDDSQTDLLLATLNRLTGTDDTQKKINLIKRISARTDISELAKLIPSTRQQLQKIKNFKVPTKIQSRTLESMPKPMVFFLDAGRQKTIEKALAVASQKTPCKSGAETNAAALTLIAEQFLNSQ